MDYTLDIPAKRMWAKVEKTDGCWIWTGGKAKGYGVMGLGAKYGGKMMLTHRLAWIIAHGPIPDGLSVLHRCDNPPCVRAECCIPGCQHLMFSPHCASHLFLGTHKDNMVDLSMKQKAREFQPFHQPRQRGSLDGEQIAEARALTALGFTVSTIASLYGVSVSYIYTRTRDVDNGRRHKTRHGAARHNQPWQ